MPETETRGGTPFRAGPLFGGVKGFNLERWGFWKRRLVDLSKDVGCSLDLSVREAVDVMTAVETEVAKACRWVNIYDRQ